MEFQKTKFEELSNQQRRFLFGPNGPSSAMARVFEEKFITSFGRVFW